MVEKNKEVVYVTYTCKRCEKAFLDIDVNNNINELPLKTRYCPECVALGYENKKTKKKLTQAQLRDKVIKQKIKENNITEKEDIKFIQKYIKKQIRHKESTGQRVIVSNIFNNAIEVLSYQSWKS